MLFNIYSLKAKGVQVHFETSAEQIHCPGKGQKLRGKGVVCREPYRYEPFPKTDRCSGLKFNIGCVLELITFEILAAERLRLMGFDNRLIIDCFANVVNILLWLFSTNDRFGSEKYECIAWKIYFQK